VCVFLLTLPFRRSSSSFRLGTPGTETIIKKTISNYEKKINATRPHSRSHGLCFDTLLTLSALVVSQLAQTNVLSLLAIFKNKK